MSEVEIDEELMKILRAGKNAVFALRESADQDRVGIPIELAGASARATTSFPENTLLMIYEVMRPGPWLRSNLVRRAQCAYIGASTARRYA